MCNCVCFQPHILFTETSAVNDKNLAYLKIPQAMRFPFMKVVNFSSNLGLMQFNQNHCQCHFANLSGNSFFKT